MRNSLPVTRVSTIWVTTDAPSLLLYSARTQGYKGETVKGVDRAFVATGDFISAVFRVMPHASDPTRFERIKRQMGSVEVVTLSQYRGGKAKPMNARHDYVIRMSKDELPINRKDEALSLIMRVCVPDLERLKKWTAPKAEILG